jgi:hypothetical protein
VRKSLSEFRDTSGIRVIRKSGELHFVKSDKLAVARIVESKRPSFIQVEFDPISKNLIWLGKILGHCEFEESNESTTVTVVYFSNKNPGVFWRVLIKLLAKFMNFQTREDKKRVIEAIEQSA